MSLMIVGPASKAERPGTPDAGMVADLKRLSATYARGGDLRSLVLGFDRAFAAAWLRCHPTPTKVCRRKQAAA
jgi:hypothetical protein